MSTVHLNGKFISEGKASVSIHNRSFRYGDGCFETIRISQGRIPLWHLHWQRLSSALQALQFQVPGFFTSDYLLRNIMELATQNGHQQLARIRLTVFRGNGGLYDPENHFPNHLIQSWPLNDVLQDINSNGLVIGLYQNGYKAADVFANIKSNNYLLYAMAALHAKQQRWNDALVQNHRGSIADATIANVFIVQNKIITTPPLSDGPVAGTMRRYLLENLASIGYTVQEASIHPNNIAAADEIFLTNAVYGIKWVKNFDDQEYGCQQTAFIYQKIIQPLLVGA